MAQPGVEPALKRPIFRQIEDNVAPKRTGKGNLLAEAKVSGCG
jgi:hypothetical protein